MGRDAVFRHYLCDGEVKRWLCRKKIFLLQNRNSPLEHVLAFSGEDVKGITLIFIAVDDETGGSNPWIRQ
jgi:hypothetical protein